jgi:hypothetical protein
LLRRQPRFSLLGDRGKTVETLVRLRRSTGESASCAPPVPSGFPPPSPSRATHVPGIPRSAHRRRLAVTVPRHTVPPASTAPPPALWLSTSESSFHARIPLVPGLHWNESSRPRRPPSAFPSGCQPPDPYTRGGGIGVGRLTPGTSRCTPSCGRRGRSSQIAWLRRQSRHESCHHECHQYCPNRGASPLGRVHGPCATSNRSGRRLVGPRRGRRPTGLWWS